MNDTDFNFEIEILNGHQGLFLGNIPTVLLQFENNQETPNSIQWFTSEMLQRLLNSCTAMARLLPEYYASPSRTSPSTFHSAASSNRTAFKIIRQDSSSTQPMKQRFFLHFIFLLLHPLRNPSTQKTTPG